MVSRNKDSVILALGVIAGIIGIISLLLTCIGVALPSWYVGKSADHTMTIAQANLFYSCYAQNASEGVQPSTLKCVSYSSFLCTTTSFQDMILNATNIHSGCLNPNSDSSVYSSLSGPIYQTSGYKFYRLRSSAVFSIMSILFIFSSAVFGFLIGILLMNIYIVFIAPILATLGIIFGVCCLLTAGSVFHYTGAGFALFTVGTLIEVIVAVLLSAIAGRLNGKAMKRYNQEDEDGSTFLERKGSSPIVVRRVLKKI